MHLFDGAMGTMLQKYGLAGSECPDYCNVSHPDIVQRIHRNTPKPAASTSPPIPSALRL